MEWQPIETAPKRGSILLWNGKEVGEGHPAWCGDGYEWAGEGHACDPRPTHWMPLPAPPAGDEK